MNLFDKLSLIKSVVRCKECRVILLRLPLFGLCLAHMVECSSTPLALEGCYAEYFTL